MRRHACISLVVLSGIVPGCSSRPVDDAAPVATPSLTVSPAVVASGSPMTLQLRFEVAPDAPAFTEDYTVFVHVLDEDGRMIGAADHLPPTPTHEWKGGSTIEYEQSAFAPTSDYVGKATVVVGLYSPATGARLPLAGEALEPRAVSVGSFEMRERADPYAVVYADGWHVREAPRGTGLEWRWSAKAGTLRFPNPKRRAELVVELDQPNAVRIGEQVVDEFDLAPGPSMLRRIALGPAELGDADLVDVTVVADKTLVPAEIADLRSDDTRRLGVRVFRAYLEPK
jgi:hypothetical protein